MTQEFKDHIVQHPNRFKRVPVAGTTDQFDLIPTWVENPSEVVQLGTPVDRQLFEGITSQLADTASELSAVENANSRRKLSFLNPYDNDQNIHPKVLDFGTLWNGYRYWMAYTPFPWGNDKQENPCVAVANDFTEWTHRTLLADTPQPTNINHYNSDTHLVYRQDTGVLECWWRYFNEPENLVRIKRRTTTDGTTWTPEQVMAERALTNSTLSPSVIFEDNLYKMWYCEPDGNVYYEESADGLTWSARRLLNITKPADMQYWWHLDVIKTDLGYELIIQGMPTGVPSAEWANLYYTKTSDNINFDMPILILKPSKREGAFDNQGIYRSSLLKQGDKYHLFYSGFAKDNTKGLGLSSGNEIDKLVGSNLLNRHLTSVERMDFEYSWLKEGYWKISDGQFAVGMTPAFDDALSLFKANGLDKAGIDVDNVKVFNSYLKNGELKLSNNTVAAVLKALSSYYLEVRDHNGNPLSLDVGGVKLDITGTSVIGGEGALKYDASIKKFQGSNGEAWQNFNREVTVPLSATANGVKGDYAVTSGFLYVCVATNTWQRVPLTTW